MREIWLLQPRFEKRVGASPFRLLDHLRYRAGYDFLLLRIEAEQADAELGQWWTDFAAAEHEERLALIKSVAKQPGQAATKKRRRRRGPRKDGAQEGEGHGVVTGPGPTSNPNDQANGGDCPWGLICPGRDSHPNRLYLMRPQA